MVAGKVEIDTLSYQADAKAVRWSCDGTTEFELDDGDRTTVGTTITLHLQEDAEEFLESAQVGSIIRKYCDFMPVKITLNGMKPTSKRHSGIDRLKRSPKKNI
jgi:molecular chaperone HtpG